MSQRIDNQRLSGPPVRIDGWRQGRTKSEVAGRNGILVWYKGSTSGRTKLIPGKLGRDGHGSVVNNVATVRRTASHSRLLIVCLVRTGMNVHCLRMSCRGEDKPQPEEMDNQ